MEGGLRIKHRFFNMYLTTTISVMLVLLMVSAGCILLLSANHLIRQVRQNVAVDIVLTADADQDAVAELDRTFGQEKYVSAYRYISSEEALEEHVRLLGEDPQRFLGYNPLRASFEVHLTDVYANPDSLSMVAESLEQLPAVERVHYHQGLLRTLDRYIHRAMVLIVIGALLLLLVSWALITNMIRLQLYSQRFLISTMALVGATSWHIRAPFVRRCVVMGLVAALLAVALSAAMIYAVHYRWGILLFPLDWKNVLFSIGVVVLSAVLITAIASSRATGRYIRMKTSSLYEI